MSAPASSSVALAAWQSAFATQSHSAAQQAAFEQFLQRGLPTARDDAWKYTDLRRLAARSFQLPAVTDHLTAAAQLFTEPGWAYLVFVDGQYSETLSTPAVMASSSSRTSCLTVQRVLICSTRHSTTPRQ